jgi:hypothetical protein
MKTTNPKLISLKKLKLPEQQETFKFFSFLNRKIAGFTIVVTALVFYITSINGEYALDDGIIIHQNDHVMKGIRGIKDILTKDAYESFYRRMCATDQLAGGRYRPLSAVSFAIEQEILGAYRTGLYTKVEDSNKNGVLDKDMVTFTNACGRTETNYEYNDFVDQNWDAVVQGNECYACWDKNRNFTNEPDEDLNKDGIHNEVDCQLYGAKFRHFTNIVCYAIGCFLLYLVFSTCFFRTDQDLAFLAALIFTMHPIHSEAIANVKSRDEIFSLIFVSLTFFYSFRYIEFRKPKYLALTALMFLLALLSKEYALMLLFLVPLAVYTFTEHDFDFKTLTKSEDYKKALYVSIAFVACAFIMTWIKRDFDVHALPGAKPIRSFWLFPFVFIATGIFLTSAYKRNNFITLMSWFFFVALIYIGMRWMAVKLKPGVPDTEILNNPYLLANGEERFCTKVYVLLKYVILLCFPHPLSSDYSFDSIPYRHFTSWDFIFSLVFHLGLVIAAIRLTLKKHVVGFALMTYILFLLMIGNILMDIGATMGERLIFHSSIGFCIAISFLALRGLEKIKRLNFTVRKALLSGCLLIVGIFSGLKTWERNFDWKNDITLFLKDVQTMPRSVLCLGNAGARYVDLASTKDFSGRKIPGYDTTFNDHNGTLKEIDEEVRSGKYKDRREAVLDHAAQTLKRAVKLHPRYVNGYLNLGLLYLQQGKDFETLFYLKNAERLYPNNPYLMNYYNVFNNNLRNRAAIAWQRNRMDSVAIAYNLLTLLQPRNAENWFNLGGAYYNQQKYSLAKKSWERALREKPDYSEAKRLLAMIKPEMVSHEKFVP